MLAWVTLLIQTLKKNWTERRSPGVNLVSVNLQNPIMTENMPRAAKLLPRFFFNQVISSYTNKNNSDKDSHTSLSRKLSYTGVISTQISFSASSRYKGIITQLLPTVLLIRFPAEGCKL